jgi:predicted permease
VSDLRFAFRQLLKHPGFTVVAVLTLALGIGANTAIFQLLDAVRLRTLPVQRPQELANIRIADMKGARGNFQSPYPAVTYPIWERVRQRQDAFNGVLAWSKDEFNLAPKGQPHFVEGLWVNGDFFSVLGVEPLLGRFFTMANDQRGSAAAAAAVVSFGCWQREFGGDASIIGKNLTLDGHVVKIIGVTPPTFLGLEIGRSFDVALPIASESILRPEAHRLDSGTTWWLNVMGRLKPDWSIARARSRLASISPGIFEETLPPDYPPTNIRNYLGFKLTALPAGTGVSTIREEYAKPLWLLLAIAGVVLLIGCANLANLLLARTSVREREIVVRLALGASRLRLLRQLIFESLLLACVGAFFGWLLAQGLSRFLIAFLTTAGNPILLNLSLDWRVFLFTVAMGMLTCALFGLVPAISGAKNPPGAALKAGGRGMTAGRHRLRFRRALVISQVAFSLLLVVGALLFSLSLGKLMALDAGFTQQGVLIAFADFGSLNLPKVERLSFKRSLIERLRALHGVAAVGDTSMLPLSGNSWDNKVWMDGSTEAQAKDSYFQRIGPEYFKTLRTQIVAGREFDDHDTLASVKVAVVNEAFARQIAADQELIGNRFWKEATPTEPATAYEIVGVVKNTKYHDLREDFVPIAFLAAAQDSAAGAYDFFVVRSEVAPAGLIPTVTGAFKEMNPEIRTESWVLKTQIQNTLTRERLMARLSGFFGSLALLLACVGLYGILSYGVANRTCEIGLRMALGAQPGSVRWLIVREGLRLVLFGLAVGLALVLVIARLMSTLLYGLTPADPTSIAGAAILMLGVAGAAAYLPARRATKVDPMEALRYE